MRTKTIVAAGLVTSCLVAMTACAQSGGSEDTSTYPDGSVKVIVPFAPGSNSDVLARVWADCYERELGTSFVVENRDGGSGLIGLTEAAGAEPDGYTLAYASLSTTVLTPFFADNPAYDADSFVPVAATGFGTYYFAVAPDSPIKTMDDLVAAGQSSKLVAADSGATTWTGLIVQGLVDANGMSIDRVTPSSLPETKRGLETGDLDFAVVTVDQTSIPWVENGELRALAVTSPDHDWAPELETLEELGYAEGQLGSGGVPAYLAAPAGTDEAIIEKLAETGATCLEDEQVTGSLSEYILPPEPFSAKELEAFIDEANNALEELRGSK